MATSAPNDFPLPWGQYTISLPDIEPLESTEGDISSAVINFALLWSRDTLSPRSTHFTIIDSAKALEEKTIDQRISLRDNIIADKNPTIVVTPLSLGEDRWVLTVAVPTSDTQRLVHDSDDEDDGDGDREENYNVSDPNKNKKKNIILYVLDPRRPSPSRAEILASPTHPTILNLAASLGATPVYAPGLSNGDGSAGNSAVAVIATADILFTYPEEFRAVCEDNTNDPGPYSTPLPSSNAFSCSRRRYQLARLIRTLASGGKRG